MFLLTHLPPAVTLLSGCNSCTRSFFRGWCATVGVGLEVPIVTGVLQGLGKLGASWIKSIIGAGGMLQFEIDDAAKAVAALPYPELPTDGDWKNGKSPCSN